MIINRPNRTTNAQKLYCFHHLEQFDSIDIYSDNVSATPFNANTECLLATELRTRTVIAKATTTPQQLWKRKHDFINEGS